MMQSTSETWILKSSLFILGNSLLTSMITMSALARVCLLMNEPNRDRVM